MESALQSISPSSSSLSSSSDSEIELEVTAVLIPIKYAQISIINQQPRPAKEYPFKSSAVYVNQPNAVRFTRAQVLNMTTLFHGSH